MYKQIIKGSENYSGKRFAGVTISGFTKSRFKVLKMGINFSKEYNVRWLTFYLLVFDMTVSWRGKLFCNHRYINQFQENPKQIFYVCEKCGLKKCVEVESWINQ